MNVKNNPNIDLNKKRGLNMAIGFVVSLAFVLAAFEWKTFYKYPTGNLYVEIDDGIEIENIIETTYRKPEEPKQRTVVKKIPTPSIDVTVTSTPDYPRDELKLETTEIDPNDLVIVEGGTIDEPDVDDEIPFVPFPEVQPKFPGGDQGLMSFLGDKIKYPEIAKENGIQGVVYVGFIVEADGSVTNVEVKRGVDPFLDKEALRVVSMLTGYSPGMQGGRTVRVPFVVPIRFQLK